ncbi:MAG: NAD-dependent dehydratase [Ignavibacteriae bacterium HGW-Ignavibacteriae-4]|jgi:nucleoside-diphosphate-sugar epimerase|nr:MAG: NAD-dependent dehydratase [Ignavibacteriae bacterium HGW-Ignavibacteriae-4]
MQTILGSGGIIGIEIAKELPKYTENIRLVARNPKKVNESDELVKADVLDYGQLEKAIAGSEILYVTVGFEYSTKVWQENWPKFMRNVIEICKKEDCKLVFFDNVYVYDENHIDKMTENTPINPPSKKGKVRAEVANLILEAVKNDGLKALIARSADFYGPGVPKNNSLLNETVFKPLNSGKKANWLCSTEYKHSFTYTVDAGKATALLGNSDKAYGQVWHLPTAANPLTGKELITLAASKLGATPKIQLAPRFIVKVMGLFMPIMKESVEMLYQYDRDYIFDSTKFEKEFGIKPTSYEDGISEVVKLDYKK